VSFFVRCLSIQYVAIKQVLGCTDVTSPVVVKGLDDNRGFSSLVFGLSAAVAFNIPGRAYRLPP